MPHRPSAERSWTSGKPETESGEPMHKITQYRVTLKRERVLQVSDVMVGSFDAAVRVLRRYYDRANLPHEELIAIGVNGRNEIVGIVKVAQGGSHGCAVCPSDIFRPLLAMNAAAFILAHNHPSGCPEPSPEDRLTTRAIKEAGDVLGIQLLDHIVIARRGEKSVCDVL